MKARRLAALVVVVAALILAGCSSGQTTKTAARPHKVVAVAKKHKPYQVATAPAVGIAPFTYTNGDFTVTFPDGENIALPNGVNQFQYTFQLLTGQTVTATQYGPFPVFLVTVYSSPLTNPSAALQADPNWDWNPVVSTYDGYPAIMTSTTVSNGQQTDEAMKVWHGGNVYVLTADGPTGSNQIQQFFDSLKFSS